MNMATYTPTGKEVWKGRIDGDEEDVLRWHQVIQPCDLENKTLPVIEEHQQGIALIGFCCDEGVRRNHGRVGAAKAPLQIRNACCNFPVFASHIMMIDAGDVSCTDGNLEAAQQLLGEKIQLIRHSGYLPIVIGGGHEVAFANFNGIIPLLPKQEFGLINFDAHFDLRQVEEGTGATSGTGISQIKSWCDAMENPFHYLAIGIQQYGNTRKLFDVANKMDAVYILSENFTEDQLEPIITIVNGILSNADILQLTIDLDVFAAPFAPGVSAPSPAGILPNSMFKRLLRHIILSGKVASVDLAETNPLYDIDNRTSRLAASLVFDIVQAADVNADW
jgi:formiminoglutamase